MVRSIKEDRGIMSELFIVVFEDVYLRFCMDLAARLRLDEL